MTELKQLRIVSYLAPNWFWFYEAVAAYLGRVFEVEMQIVQSQCDPLEDPILWQERLDLAFICGLPFMRYCQLLPEQLQALVAPVMQAPRYQNRPIYFADVIVNVASDLANFEDLAGKTLCYNDAGSNSGYHLLRARLIQGKYSKGFFGQAIQSGSHQRSIQWVIEGLADCSAIDSTVLEQELQDFPQLSHHLRVIESLGPSPMPPLVAAQHLGDHLTEQIQSALLQPDAQLQAAMKRAGVQRYAAVPSAEYEGLAQSFNIALRSSFVTLG